MKRCYKRTLAVLLVLALCCQLLPISTLADENELISPKLIVRGRYGYDVTYGCSVEWSNGGEVLSEPIAVEPGTTLSYTVTPTDELAENGVLYYAAVSGEVTLMEPDQQVEVYLVRLGTVTVKAQNQDYDEIPIDENGGYTALWYEKDGEEYVPIGEGLTSPLRPVESTVYCDVTMTGRNAEIYPAETKHEVTIWYYGNDSEWITFTTDKTASPVLTVTGYEGVDLTGKVNVVWRDRGWNELEPPYTVRAGSVGRYKITPKNALKIDGVQYYQTAEGEVRLYSEDQPVDVTLGQQGRITVTLVDKKTGEPLPMSDENAGWSVDWYNERGYRIGGGITSPLRTTGENISCYFSLRDDNSTNYVNPGSVPFTVGFGPKTVAVEAAIKVPTLREPELTRRVSQQGLLDVYRYDNGYTFEYVSYNGEPLIDGLQYSFTSYNFSLKPEYLASLGVGTHVFTVHYAETTEEDNYDSQLTLTLTKGDLAEVSYSPGMNTLIPKEYYTGEPITIRPYLYVGTWANDNRQGMLIEGVDYELRYENNINASTDGNPAKLIFTGLGDYAGSTRTETFKILPCEVNTGFADLEVVPQWDWPYLYDGTPKDMTDVKVYSRGKELVEGVDYEVCYMTWNNMDEAVSSHIGSPDKTVEVPIEIHGIGNYTSVWSSQNTYADQAHFYIMPHVETTVTGGMAVGGPNDTVITWSWSLDSEGNMIISGQGAMPDTLQNQWSDYKAMIKRLWLGTAEGDNYSFRITSIPAWAFSDCVNLVEAIVPESIETLGYGCFHTCRNLKTIHTPGTNRLSEALQTIEWYALGTNSYNLAVHLPDNVTSIGAYYAGPSDMKLYCNYGTTTHETLKAKGKSGMHIIEGYDGYFVEYSDNYNLGGTYTVCGYFGHGGEETIPDFLDSLTHYDIFGQQATLITKLTIPGSIRVLNGDAFRFLDNCREVVIEPGEMDTLIQSLLSYHRATVLTIPDTVTTMPAGDFTYFYYDLLMIVGEGSAAQQWAIEHGYQPEDGTGRGKQYRVVKNSQPFVTPLGASIASDTLEDVSFAKNDGDFTFDSLTLGETALAPGSDYKVEGDTVTLKAAFVNTLEIGTHEIRLHYTGLAGENNELSAIDPVFKLTVVQRCRPVLTVLDKDGQDVTAHCTVVWKNGNTVLEEPISVAAGTTLTYTVTPNEELKLDGVQYYKFVTGSVRLTETEQPVETSLRQLGSVSVTPTFAGEPIDEGWTIRWFLRSGSGYSQLATGETSPLVDAGKELFYDVLLSGENALDYVNVNKKSAGTVVFGNTALEVALQESPTRYDVRFYLNGGTESEYGSCRDQSIQRNHEVVLPVAPVRRGYVFSGWKANYDGAVYQPGEAVIVKQSSYFYAQWTEKNALTLSFEGLGLLAGSVSLVGVTDSGEEVSIWGMNRSVWEQEPVTLPNHYRNDHTLVSLVLRGRVDGATVELARYDDPDGDLYNDEGTLTLTKTGSWTPVTEIKADGLEAGTDYVKISRVYSDPNFSRYSDQNVPFLTDGTATYYVRFSGVSCSENYTNHDWTKVYALTLTDGVLHASVDKITPALWTGRVVYGKAIPAKNATVTVTQSAYGLERSYSAVTDETGSFTVEGFPDTYSYISVNWGGRKAYEHGQPSLSQDMVLTLNSVRVSWRVDFDGVFDESLRGKLLTWSHWSSPEIQFTSVGKFAIRWGTAFAESRSQALYNVDPDAVTWEISDKYGAIEPVSGTLTFTDGAAEIEQTLTLQAGVLVHVSADITCGAKLAWFDADGGFVGFSGVNLGLYGNDGRDWLCVCPNEDGGSYTVALLYNDVALADDVLLSDIPATWILNTWENVTLGKNEVVELEAFRVTEEMKDNARYATKPASTLSADQDCFTDVYDLLTFSGSIGLDAEMKNGKISSLSLLAKIPGLRVDTPAMQLEALVIDGRVYGPDDFSLGHGNYSLDLRGEEISLPCEYKLYCRPATPEVDVRFTMEVDGSYTYGAGHYINFYNQPVGTGTAYRPGSVIRTLSTYVCGDTVTVKGTAQKYEAVQLFDGEALIGSVNADCYGEWSLTAPLEGADPQYMTVHLLHSETASGTRSRDLWLVHDPNGPELKRFTMTYDSGREIDVGASYTVYGSSIRDVIFKAAFEHSDKLDLMAGGTRLIFKYCCYNGEVGYLNATYDETENVYTATIPGSLGSAIFSAEVIYEPILSYPGVDQELNMTADFPGSPNYVPETAVSVDEDLASVYFDAVAQIQENNKGKTEADSFAVSFAYGETVSGEAVGRLPEGAALSDFTDAAEAMSELGLNLAEIGVNYGTATDSLTRILQAGQTWLNERPKEAGTGLFNHTIQFPTKEMLENGLDLLSLSADAQYTMQADMNGTPVDARFLVFTDADVDAEELSGTYFITVQAICDERNGLFQISTTTVLTKDFTGFSETLTAAANEPTRGATRYTIEIGHLPEWYNWAWESLNTASGSLSAIFGLTNGGLDMLNAFPHLSSLCGKASGGMALVNQFTSTVNYMVACNKDAKTYGDKIDMLKNSPCYKKAMQWLYEKGMDDPNFDDGNLYQDHCRLLDAMKNVDFSGNLSGLQKANFYVNSACNGLAIYAALGGPVSWGVGLGATFFGLAFGYLTDKQVEEEEAARKFLYNRFMSDCAELFTMYSHANKHDPDCREFSSSKSKENAPDVQQPPQTMKVCYDPSGTVFEAVIENPVEGATVQLYYAIDENGNLVQEDLAGTVSQLVPASEVRDLIPDRDTQTTDEAGRYAWFVPEGLWYVGVECAGYEPGSSNDDKAATVYSWRVGKNLLPVLPVQVDVNIPLVDYSAPYVTDTLYTEEGVYVTFSKYMEERELLKTGSYAVTVRKGGTGSAEDADFTIRSAEQGHVPDNLPNAGTTYTRTVFIQIDDLVPGDVVHWTVSGSVRSYAGTSLQSSYSASGAVGDVEVLDAPVLYVDGAAVGEGINYVSRGSILELRLPDSAAEIGSARIVYSTDGGETWKTYTDALSLTNNVDISARVEAIGYCASDLRSASFVLSNTLQFSLVASVAANDGSDVEGLTFTLENGDGFRESCTVVQGGIAFFKVPNGAYTLSFAGNEFYQPLTRTVEVTDNNVLFSVVLSAIPCEYELTGWSWTGFTAAEAAFTCKIHTGHVQTVEATVTSVRTEPDCTQNGSIVYTATVVFEGYTYTDVKTEVLDATGHDWNAPSYRWAADNHSVTASRVCKHNASHTESETVSTTPTVTKPASCTAAGETTYSASFVNPAFTAQTKTVADVPALGHKPGAAVTENSTAPDCTKHGGYDTAVYCTVCGAELSREHTELAPLGHDWNEGTIQAAPNCTKEGVRLYTCRRCGETKTEVISAVGHTPGAAARENETAASCTVAGGYDTVIRCTVCSAIVQSTHTELPTIGHSWNEPEYKWTDDLGAVTATHTCRRDASHVETQTVQTVSETVKEATFDAEGEIRYTARFTNPAFPVQTQTVVIPKLVTQDNPFVDVEKGKFYYDAVLWAVYHDPKITTGTDETHFKPGSICTRAQIVAFLWRAKGCPTPKNRKNPFTDVKETAYYYDAILWAVEENITTGTSATTFGPKKDCTRAQVVTFLWRAEGEPKLSGAQSNPFADVKSSAYYYTAVLWAVEKDITTGVNPTTFRPNGSCTRGQIVTFLHRDIAK